MTEVMTERRGFRQVFVEPKTARDGSCDLRNLQRMRKPCAVVVVLGTKKDLRFVHQASKRFGVNDAVAVTLKFRACGTGRRELFSAPRVFTKTSKLREIQMLSLANHLRNRHKHHLRSRHSARFVYQLIIRYAKTAKNPLSFSKKSNFFESDVKYRISHPFFGV
jgi:hypothetical protein